MLYYVRKAKPDDLSGIMLIIDNGRDVLNKAGVPQWQNNEGPNELTITNDLTLEEGYVLIEENRLIGYGTITTEKQEEYLDIVNGNWEKSEKYVSLHRVAIHSAVQEKGKGTFFLGYLISMSVALGYNDIRIDTHPKNKRMQKLIKNVGFTFKGDITLDVSNGERYAYQLII